MSRWAAGVLLGALLVLTGGRLAYYESQLPTTLHPLFARTMVDRRAQELVFDRLFYRSTVTYELRSRLVVDHQRQVSGRAVRLDLRSDVTWHDGTPFTPHDVCFTVDVLRDPQTPSPLARVHRETLAGCRVIAGSPAVVIQFTRPLVDPRVHLGFPVLPKHVLDGAPTRPDVAFSAQPVGTGPWQALRGRREVQFTAAPNAHRSPQLQAMSLTPGRDPVLQVRTLLNGGVQGIIAVPPPLRAEVAASDHVALRAYDLRSWWFIALNHRHPALAYPEVREALGAALDRQRLVELTVGVDPHDIDPPCELITGPFVPSSPYYNRTIRARGHADRALARQRMTEVGATLRDGRWVLDDAPVVLRLGMHAPLTAEARDLLEQVAAQWAQAGFETELQLIDTQTWAQEVVSGRAGDRFDAVIGAWSFGTSEDVSALFHSRTETGQGLFNIFDHADPQVDQLLARFEEARTDLQAQNAYHDLHARLAEERPYLFLWKLDTRSAWRNEVRGTTIAPYYYFTDIERWRLRSP